MIINIFYRRVSLYESSNESAGMDLSNYSAIIRFYYLMNKFLIFTKDLRAIKIKVQVKKVTMRFEDAKYNIFINFLLGEKEKKRRLLNFLNNTLFLKQYLNTEVEDEGFNSKKDKEIESI